MLMAFVLPLMLLQPGLSQAATINPDDWVTVPQPPSPTLQNLQIPADAASKGMWSPVYPWPFNGLHAALLPDGRVFSFGTNPNGRDQNGRWYDVWDPALGMGTNAHNTVYNPEREDSFCASLTYLANGDLLISGGNGEFTSTLYEPTSHSSFTDPSTMAETRWYPTLITMADGRPIIMGGMVPYTEDMVDNPDLAIANGWASMTPEVYENGQWRSLFGAYSREAFGPDFLRTSYPRAWAAPNGLVFGIAGDKMWYLDADANGGNGGIVKVWDYKRFGRNNPVNAGAVSTAAMFAPGRILQVGGNGGHNSDGLPASNLATVVDIRGGTPQLAEQKPMRYARRYPNSLVLATGEVVVTGGTTYGNHYLGEPGQVVFAAEIWNPVTGDWTDAASAAVVRVYHSITTLLPDGTLLSTGGGTPGPVTNLNAEIYYPPNLFRSVNGRSELAPRPRIAAISGLAYGAGDPLQLDLASEEPIRELVLMGVSNSTHSFNSGQRRIPLTFTQQQFRLSTSLPELNLTPPGYYQVVAINSQGVPSKGVIIGIGQNLTPPPVVVQPYTPPSLEEPINTPSLRAGETANYSVTATPGATYSWSFSDTGTSTPFSADPRVSHRFDLPGLYVITLTARSATGETSTKTVVQAVATGATAQQPAASSQLAREPRSGGDRIWVVNPDNNSVSVVDANRKQLIREIPVGDKPSAVAVSGSGQVWVSNKDSASISVINPDTLAVVRTIPLPRASQPHGLVFAANGATAYVVLEASGQLLRLDAASGAVQAQLALGQHPRHLAISGDGRLLLVSRFITPPLPGEGSASVNVNAGGGEVLVINASTFSLQRTVLLRHSDLQDTDSQGSGIPNYLGAAAIAPDGRSAWVPSKQDNIARGSLRNGLPLNFENTVRAISSHIDLGSFSEQLGLRVDLDNAGVASAAAWHGNGVYLFVALETSREVAVVNGLDGSELFRIQVGLAPQSLALSADGLTLYVKEFMDRQLAVVDLRPLLNTGELRGKVIARVATVQQETLSATVLAGKKLFYDARDPRLSLDSYLSCASCHNDGDQDGRVWDLTAQGEGLRNTIALRGRAATGQGFLHWSANFDELQDFEGQIRDLAGGTGLMSDADYLAGSRRQPLGDKKAGISSDLDNLAAYVSSLSQFAPSPYRQADGTLTDSAKVGKDVFVKNCQGCHGGSGFTRSGDAAALQDIGTIRASSGQRLSGPLSGIDIPTLRDVWATAPYLHNGSAPTLRAAIQAHNGTDFNGAELSSTDLNNLTSYLQQVGAEEPAAGVFADGRWNFNEGAGNRTADLSGHDQNLQLNYTTWQVDRAGYVGKFNGFNAVASSGTPILDTSASFTVSAWVKLDHLYGWQTFVNQDGNQISGFWLQYSRALGRKFAFTMHDADGLNSNPFRAVSTTIPVAGRWYHLVGVRDRQQGTIKLYVNGVLESTTNYSGGWSANGSLNVGLGKWGLPNQPAAAAMDDVSVYRYAMAAGDVTQLYDLDRPNYAPTVTLTAPADQSLFKQGSPIRLQANASDPDDAIAAVRFYNGAELLAVDTAAPWQTDWDAPIGTHHITAVAVDARGLTATSAERTIFVEDPRLQNLAPLASLATSYVTPWQSLAAIVDGIQPRSSADAINGAYGNLNGYRSYGASNWVSFSWASPKQLTSVEVYWWRDGLGILEPTTARVEYWNGLQWVELGAIGVQINRFNRLDVNVTTSSLRIVMQGTRATGILEARVKGFP